MTITQLEQDLLANARKRLQLWVKDTYMRCDIVEMDDARQISIIFSALIDLLTEAAVGMKMDREELLWMVGRMYDEEVKNKPSKVKERG